MDISMDGNQQNHSGFILCGRYMICMLSVCGGQMKIAFPESTAAALLKTGLHFWVGPKVKRFSPRDHLTALIWGRGWASLADCSGGSSKQRGMDGLPRGRRKERWPSPPGARCPQGRPSGSREGGGGSEERRRGAVGKRWAGRPLGQGTRPRPAHGQGYHAHRRYLWRPRTAERHWTIMGAPRGGGGGRVVLRFGGGRGGAPGSREAA